MTWRLVRQLAPDRHAWTTTMKLLRPNLLSDSLDCQ